VREGGSEPAEFRFILILVQRFKEFTKSLE
jgi:hypothetical protein